MPPRAHKRKPTAQSTPNSSAPTTPKRTPNRFPGRRHEWTPVKKKKNATRVDISKYTTQSADYFIRGKIMRRTEMIKIGDQQQLSFSAIVADASGDFKVSFYGYVAERWHSLVKTNAIVEFSNLELLPNADASNYTPAP